MFMGPCFHVLHLILVKMWQLLGHEDTIAYEPCTTYDEAKLVEDTITCVVQVNGKSAW